MASAVKLINRMLGRESHGEVAGPLEEPQKEPRKGRGASYRGWERVRPGDFGERERRPAWLVRAEVWGMEMAWQLWKGP